MDTKTEAVSHAQRGLPDLQEHQETRVLSYHHQQVSIEHELLLYLMSSQRALTAHSVALHDHLMVM